MSTILLLSAIVGMVWFIVAAHYPRHAVWALLLWLPIQGWIQLNVFNDANQTVLIYEFQIIGLYIIFAFRAMRQPAQFGPPAVVRYAVPFVAWTLLLVPYSVAQTGLVLTLVGLRTYLLPLPLVWIGYRAFASRRQFENVAALVMLQLVIIALVTVAQFTGIASMRGVIVEVPTGFMGVGTGVVRPPGTFSAPGHLGNYLLFSIPFAIGLLGLRTSFRKRLYIAVGLSAATVAMMANTQRSAMVLLAVVLSLMIVLARRGKAAVRVAIAVCVMAVGGALVASVTGAAVVERLESISRDTEMTLFTNPADRMDDALQTPILGVGLGAASPGAGRLTTGSAQDPSARGESLKNGESSMAALIYETGVPGLVLFYLFIGALMYSTLQFLRVWRKSEAGLLASALLAYEIAIVLYNWSYAPLQTPPARVLFWFWIGVLLSLPSLRGAKRADAPVVQNGPQQRLVTAMTRRSAPPRTAPAARRAI